MGVNSTAALVGLWLRGIRPDFIPAADTKGEKARTYDYIPIFREWLRLVSFPDVDIVHRDWGKDQSLEDQCLRLGVLPSIAYGWKTCSIKWKKDPQDRFLRSQPALQSFWQEGRRALKVISYDAGERHRAEGKEGDSEYELWFPLIEWEWDRDECKRQILAAGLSLPPKSACFFCSATTPNELVRLSREDPERTARALELERRALSGEGEGTFKTDVARTKGLGRRWNWSDYLANDQRQQCLIETELPCECHD